MVRVVYKKQAFEEESGSYDSRKATCGLLINVLGRYYLYKSRANGHSTVKSHHSNDSICFFEWPYWQGLRRWLFLLDLACIGAVVILSSLVGTKGEKRRLR